MALSPVRSSGQRLRKKCIDIILHICKYWHLFLQNLLRHFLRRCELSSDLKVQDFGMIGEKTENFRTTVGLGFYNERVELQM